MVSYISNQLKSVVLVCRLCSGGFISEFELDMHHKNEPTNGATAEFGAGNSPTLTSNETSLGEVEGECGICFELMECPTKTPCGHW